MEIAGLIQVTVLLSLGAHARQSHEETGNIIISRHTRAAEGDCFQSLVVKGNGGTLTSPNYPSHYPSSADCKWLLTTEEPNATILLKIDSLSIEPDTGCKLDYLQVYQGSTSLSPALGPFCGTISNRLLKTNSSRLLLVFHSDPVYEDKGFSLDYFTQTTADCRNQLTAGSGSLRSPGFPGNYPDNTDCWTLITVETSKKIVLFLDSVDMEYGENCTFDFVRVFDGDTRNSSLLGHFCRQTDTVSLESSTHSLLIHFHSDDSVNRKGYRARYSSIDKRSSPEGTCLWETSEYNGTVASPNYPSNYPSTSNCSLWILAPPGGRIFITFDALQLEMDPKCLYDFLQVEEPSNSDKGVKVLGRYCGNEGEAKNLTSSGNEVHIVFQADDFVEFSGFKLRYTFLGVGHKEKTAGIEEGPQSPPEKPKFSVVPQNATLEAGAAHMLHCATPDATAKIQWLKGDTVLVGGSPMAGLQVLPNNTLWIRSMEHGLSGIYACVVQSAGASVSAKAYVLVKNQPHKENSACGIVFRKTPRDTSLAEGEFGHLECLAAGEQVQVTWEKDGAPLSGGGSGRLTLLKAGHLFVDKAEAGDAGVYTCVAKDVSQGCERKASALLQVTRKIDVDKICGVPKLGWSLDNVTHNDNGKIIGGHDAKKGAYPWMAMLWEPVLKSFCGGALLSERWVLTAAHCFVNYRNLRWDRVVVKLGKHDRFEEEHAEFSTGIADRGSVVVHPAYNSHTFDNDLALVRLREHAPFSDRILPACLGDRSLGEALLRGGGGLAMGTVVGWGKLKEHGPSPRYLQEVRLPVVEQAECVRSTNFTVTRNMFCAGYKQEILGDSCHGDSGGPFQMASGGRWYLVGVVSWGEGCGDRDKYGFYTRIANYVSWIRGIIKS